MPRMLPHYNGSTGKHFLSFIKQPKWLLTFNNEKLADAETLAALMRSVTLDSSNLDAYQVFAPNGMRIGVASVISMVRLPA